MHTRYFRAALASITLCACVALASFTVLAQPPSSLYGRLGGKPAITAVVDEFVARVAADKRITAFFAGVAADPARLAAFKGKLVDQICEASGGPCKYSGKQTLLGVLGPMKRDIVEK